MIWEFARRPSVVSVTIFSEQIVRILVVAFPGPYVFECLKKKDAFPFFHDLFFILVSMGDYGRKSVKMLPLPQIAYECFQTAEFSSHWPSQKYRI